MNHMGETPGVGTKVPKRLSDLQQTVTGCKMDYSHIYFVCLVAFFKKIIFVNFLHTFKKMNTVKYENPRKSKDCGCQNRSQI